MVERFEGMGRVTVQCFECDAEAPTLSGLVHNAGCPIKATLDLARDGLRSVVVGETDDARPEDVAPRPAPDVIGERLARIERALDEQVEWWRALGDDVRKIMAAVEAPKKPGPLDELNSAALNTSRHNLNTAAIDSHERRLAAIVQRLDSTDAQLSRIDARLGAVEWAQRTHWNAQRGDSQMPSIQRIDPIENPPHPADRGGDTRATGEKHANKASDSVTLEEAAQILADSAARVDLVMGSKASNVTHEHQTENICGASPVWASYRLGNVAPLDAKPESIRTRRRKWWPFG